jgi:hypothetical protein
VRKLFAACKFSGSAARRGLLLALLSIVAFPVLGSTANFSVPDDVALRIRLDDTLTSVDSEVGDPFSATVVGQGDYQGARVYGHISNIDMSGRIDGHTSMMLQFDRLVMPDGRRASIHAEIIQLYHAPSGEKVDIEGAIESSGRGRRTVEHTILGAGAGALLVGFLAGGRERGLVRLLAGRADWGLRLLLGGRRLL